MSGSNIYLPTAVQESATSSNVPMATAVYQSPLASALNIDTRVWVTRVGVTATAWRTAFGCMYAATGTLANVNTASFWLNRTRAWRTRSISGNNGVESFSDTNDQGASTYFPSVSASPQGPGHVYPTGYQIFNDPFDDFGAWVAAFGGVNDYDGVPTGPSPQNVDGSTYASGGQNVTQSLSNEDSAGACVTDMQTFLFTLSISNLWGTSPPTIYHDYVKNLYAASDGDYNNPSYGNLSGTYTDFNTDITNLASDRTTFVNYAYDGVYYPIPNFSSDAILPGPFGAGNDIGSTQGLGAFGIIGDWSRCRVGYVPHTGSGSGGLFTTICDRVQIRVGAPMRVTVFEQGYYSDSSAFGKVLLRPILTLGLVGGQVYEIPQPSFSGPFITHQGGAVGDACIHSMDVIIVFNSDIGSYRTAYGSSNATIISAW